MEVEMKALREFSRQEGGSIIRYYAGNVFKCAPDKVEAMQLTGKAEPIQQIKKGK
jgi:hypothetical protein